MSKVLLIGNGPSALGHKMGEIINSNKFDKVIRFNRWKFDVDGNEHKTDFSEFAGSRCDYWVVNDLHVNNGLVFKKNHLYEQVLIYMPNFKWGGEALLQVEQIEKKHNNIHFIPPQCEDDINNIVNFKPQWPSTGVIGIHFAIRHFDEVYLYGFDTYDKKYDTLHYFEGINTHYGRNKFKDKDNIDHTPTLEKDYIKYITQNNNIKYLKK